MRNILSFINVVAVVAFIFSVSSCGKPLTKRGAVKSPSSNDSPEQSGSTEAAAESGPARTKSGRIKRSRSKKYHSQVSGILNGNLVDSSGNAADIKRITSKKYLLIYYSAHWCPPCRGFTPKLVAWYNANHKDYEVVFVSGDKNSGAMLSYMKGAKMPWVAAKFQTPAHQKMQQFRKGNGIPCMVLLDSDDKRVAGSFTEDGRNYLGPQNAYDKLKSLLGI
jgi:thiol-disulfide isomerase/thioredoxin